MLYVYQPTCMLARVEYEQLSWEPAGWTEIRLRHFTMRYIKNVSTKK